MRNRIPAALSGALALIIVSACGHAPPRTADAAPPPHARGQAEIPPWGLDLNMRDPAVRPGDDFFRYADGRWMDANTIPADRNNWGSFGELDERSTQQQLALVQALPTDAAAGTNAQKVGDYYRAFTDTAAIDAKGLGPARPALDAIAAARNHEDLARLMGRSDLGLLTPLRIGIAPDQKDPDRYAVTISQSGLGLPDRDYYLKDDAVYRTIRTQYLAHITRLLTLAGEANPAAEAQGILDVETRMAKLHWPVAKRRDRDLTYNARTRAQLQEMAPGFAWEALFTSDGLAAQPQFVVRELDAVAALAKLFPEVPVDTWRPYFKYHYLVDVSAVLPQPFDAEVFEFYGHTLSGQQEQRPRPKRAMAALNSDLGEAVGALYVERYFPASSKEQVRQLVENLRASYAQRIEALPWMTPATKKVALEKLAAFHPKLGYPDKWRDYSGLAIEKGDAFGNAARSQVFEWHREVARLGGPTDRGEWGMTPQTINAYYNPTFNEVVFPAAILQPPFFDPHADPAVNYGGIGAVIGHEMGHGFDDQGAKSDARGVLHTWWDAADTAAFKTRTDALATQYDGFTVLPGLNVNGRLTLGENIGDLGGVSVAYAAYHRSLGDHPAPVRDGLSGDQRFFLSYAQIWRALSKDEYLRKQVLSNPHSPPQFRVNGVVRNIDAWYSAFNVQPGDKLYLPPDARVHIW
jgi:putative endopeptidase